MNAPVRAWVATFRPFSVKSARECSYCGGEGCVLAPNGAADEFEAEVDVCPACRGSKVLEWCEHCLAMTDGYELGDECRATRTVVVQVDATHEARRLVCDSDECAGVMGAAACKEAQQAAAYRAAMNAANAQPTCRHDDVPFACGKCNAEFEAKLVELELAALECVRDRGGVGPNGEYCPRCSWHATHCLCRQAAV